MLSVNVVCRNYRDDRVIPRFSRYLSGLLGWALTDKPERGFDVCYLSGYFEIQLMKGGPIDGAKVAAYFTHLETEPPGNAKAKLFHATSKRVDLRIATAEQYANILAKDGDTELIDPPVERGRFTPPKTANKRLTAGFSGYTYRNKRKGEDLAKTIVNSPIGKKLAWSASGRGWPVPTKKYQWAEMPDFYRSLDVLVVTSRVEGVPMPPLECLSCGVSIVIPVDVGMLDTLPDIPGIYRYKPCDVKGAIKALSKAVSDRSTVDRMALRDVTERFSITNWCEHHRAAFEEIL